MKKSLLNPEEELAFGAKNYEELFESYIECELKIDNDFYNYRESSDALEALEKLIMNAEIDPKMIQPVI